jgi:protein-tyrosine phosphatase
MRSPAPIPRKFAQRPRRIRRQRAFGACPSPRLAIVVASCQAMPHGRSIPHADRITDGIFLGGWKAAKGARRGGPMWVVNVTDDLADACEDEAGWRHLRVPLADATSRESRRIYRKRHREAHAFIDEALRRGVAVLVHCELGVSRSATLVCHYLVRRRGWRWHDAEEFLRRRRPRARPSRWLADRG